MICSKSKSYRLEQCYNDQVLLLFICWFRELYIPCRDYCQYTDCYLGDGMRSIKKNIYFCEKLKFSPILGKGDLNRNYNIVSIVLLSPVILELKFNAIRSKLSNQCQFAAKNQKNICSFAKYYIIFYHDMSQDCFNCYYLTVSWQS